MHTAAGPRRARIAALFFLLWSTAVLSAELSFSAASWFFGEITGAKTVTLDLEVRNGGAGAVRMSFLATCSCLSAVPPIRTIQPGESAVIRLSYDSSEDAGAVEKFFLIRSDDPSLPKAFFAVRGTVHTETQSAGGAGPATSASP